MIEGEQPLAVDEIRAVSVADFVELRFKPGTWAAKGFPEQGCWIRTITLERIIDGGGDLDIQDVIASLLDFLPVAPDRHKVLMTFSQIANRHAAAPASGSRQIRQLVGFPSQKRWLATATSETSWCGRLT